MKNEVLARAISDIDDDLIAEAVEKTAKRRREYKWAAICAVAACLVLLCSAVLVTQYYAGFTITAYGMTVAKTPVPVEMPVAPADAYRNRQDMLSVPLEMTGKEEIDIDVIDGTVAVSDVKDNRLLYSGQSGTVKGPVTAWWNVIEPDETQIYRLQINGNIVLQLSYDQDAAQWLLQQQ